MSGPDFLPPLPPRLDPTLVPAALQRHGGDVDAFLAELADLGGVLVAEAPELDGVRVEFARPVTEPDESVVVLIDTITHMLRHQLGHFTLDRHTLHGTDLHVGAFLLPRGLRATTSLLIERDLDPAITETRDAWRSVYARTHALSEATEVVLTPDGGHASVLALPGAPASPFTDPFMEEASGAAHDAGALDTTGTVHRAVLDSAALGVPMDVWAWVPPAEAGPPRAVLMATDGERWDREYPLAPALQRLHAAGDVAPTLCLFFGASDRSQRGVVLGAHAGMVAFLRDELLPWAAGFTDVPADPRSRAISGASLGGLTAADVLLRAPELVANAVVQSGSFWWPGEDPDAEEGLPLRQWREQGPRLAEHVRVIQHVGTLEGHLLGCNRAFRDVLTATGVPLEYTEYIGGHDYACWRTFLLHALPRLFPAARPQPVTAGTTGATAALDHHQQNGVRS